MTKSAHEWGATVNRGPWVFLESRTWTASGVVATSAQSLGLLLSLWLLLNHAGSEPSAAEVFRIMEALADRWGVSPGPFPRKTVWAELDLVP